MPLGMNSMSPGCMILTPISVSHFSAPLTQKMISWASMLRCQKPMSCLRRLETSILTRVGGVEPQRRAVGLVDVGRAELLGENVDHAEDLAVLQHARIDHRRLVVGKHDVLAVDRYEFAINGACRLILF